MIFRCLPIAAAFVVLVVSGLVHGIWTQRWQESSALEEACERVALVPLDAGEWKGSNLDVDPGQFRATRAAAWWMRRYDKEDAGAPFTVILMCGRPDHMSVHTPDICYRGAGFEIAGQQARETIALGKDGTSAEVWTARFIQPSKTAAPELRIYWTWSGDGSWQAPSTPRWKFGGNSFLYKLYLVRETTRNANDAAAANDLMQKLLPVLEKSLFSGKSPQS